MSRIRSEERHRVFLARQEANRRMLALPSVPTAACSPPSRGRWLGQLLKAMMVVALLSGGWFAYHAVEFHVPTSLVEALMPRLEW